MTILYVEDNQGHAELVIRSLEEYRVANTIHHVNNGEDALNYLFNRGKFSDKEKYPRSGLVLLDLRLPRVDGLEVLKTMKETEATADIPVVILATSSAERDVAMAYKYHANSYLVKPLDFNKFDEMIKGIGFYWLVLNHISE